MGIHYRKKVFEEEERESLGIDFSEDFEEENPGDYAFYMGYYNSEEA